MDVVEAGDVGGGEEGVEEEADVRMYMYIGVLSLLVAESQVRMHDI